MLESIILSSHKKQKRSKSVLYDYISIPLADVPVLKPKEIEKAPSPFILRKIDIDTKEEDFSLNSDNETQVNSEEAIAVISTPVMSNKPKKKKRSILNALCKRKKSKM